MRFLIFLLLLLGCSPECMVISEASEIQFWATGSQTSFNLESEGYTDDYCFHQKFLCTGERKFQGYDEDGVIRDYFLIGFDEDGEEIFNQQFDVEQDYPGNPEDIFSPYPLTGWTNILGVGVVWGTSGSFRTATFQNPVTTDNSRKLSSPINVTAQTFPITMIVSTELAVELEIIFYKEGVSVGEHTESVPVGDDQEITFEISTSDIADQVTVQIIEADISLSEEVFTLKSMTAEAEEEPGSVVVYSLEMIPSDESMCDKEITFKIYTGTEITDGELDIEHEDSEELFYSDAVDFVSTWANSPGSGRVDIQYKSVQNFADLIYDSGSPYFQIQLEGRFRKEKKITAQKSLELTDIVLNTASSIKKQRKLTIDDVPDYMHTKINLILAHASSGSVLVNGIEISVEEEYAEGDRPESYPMTPAEIWLTEKNYYKHNVI